MRKFSVELNLFITKMNDFITKKLEMWIVMV